jgi:Ca-activated chloride channel family protein
MGGARDALGAGAVSLGRPELLWLALALPLFLLMMLVAYARRRRRVMAALGEPALVRRLGAGELARFPILRAALLIPAAALLGLGAADPRWGAESVVTHSRAFNVALALDASKSMWTRDVPPDRLDQERLLARLLLRELPGDRFGVVVFAGRAYTLSPLTVDHAALELYVDALDPEMVSQGGTSLASAIRQATALVRAEPQLHGDRAVVLMTDGEALEEPSDVLAAAREAAGAGVTIFTAGLGTTQGAPIPDLESGTGGAAEWKRDLDGTIVISHLDETLLKQIASITHGEYFRMAAPGATSALLTAVRELHRSPGMLGHQVEQKEQYAWFLAGALLLLVLDTVVARRALMRAHAAAGEQRVVAGIGEAGAGRDAGAGAAAGAEAVA